MDLFRHETCHYSFGSSLTTTGVSTFMYAPPVCWPHLNLVGCEVISPTIPNDTQLTVGSTQPMSDECGDCWDVEMGMMKGFEDVFSMKIRGLDGLR